jgi:hypothetical protein
MFFYCVPYIIKHVVGLSYNVRMCISISLSGFLIIRVDLLRVGFTSVPTKVSSIILRSTPTNSIIHSFWVAPIPQKGLIWKNSYH